MGRLLNGKIIGSRTRRPLLRDAGTGRSPPVLHRLHTRIAPRCPIQDRWPGQQARPASRRDHRDDSDTAAAPAFLEADGGPAPGGWHFPL